ncbi:liver-expressed antimicrobial peptide 2 [Paramisgurnus dabryanus]|uniref:Liver expressed antimicrobial peptide 2A n=1 Tax=Misgurnus mizolepis TaxID=93600 RepID=A0A1P8VJT9_MISMI|nr:liver-expressed antimicrobial peptide 2 [Misgurnus anguillicaudatus]APZ76684.1 liver expressed antimicrobial peptide 2A [Misgurnus mizolepis]APZ76686.1 liver expressed antimicrobial peptide 2A [Misgurnus mizolepis]
MQNHNLFNRGTVVAWWLVFLVLVQQLACSPVPPDKPSTSEQEVQMSPKRTARMTPLWRIMGTKPHGAFCQNNYECSTGICRKGHCSYSQPINS